jgi:hypothetical protein
MNYEITNKPWVYGSNWNVFDDVILKDIRVYSCNNTINGFCENTESLEECIKICEEAPLKNCTYGYFIETPYKKYCAPVINKKVDYPYQTLVKKDYYKELNDVNTNFFANKNIYNFPVFSPNIIFYRDNFVISHDKTYLSISSSLENLEENIIFTDDKSLFLNVTIIPKKIDVSNLDMYKAVRNGDEFILNIPNTSLLLHKLEDDTFIWKVGLDKKNFENNKIVINCLDKKVGDILTYDDKICFSIDDHFINVEKNVGLVLNKEKNRNKENLFFSLIPKVEVYYCDNNKCNKLDLDKATEVKGIEAYYNGKKLYRYFCQTICGNKNKNDNSLIIVIIVIVILVLFILYFKKFLIFK